MWDNLSSFNIPTSFDGHYDHWSLLMENFLRSKEYWHLIENGVGEPANAAAMQALTNGQKAKLEENRLKDMKAKNYLFQSIDRSILETILMKDNSKQIWDSMKKKYQGTAKVKRAHLQALRLEFETLRQQSTESVSQYFSKVMAVANKMRINGEKMGDITIIEKILRSMTSKYDYVVCSIEESKDLDELSIDELMSSLLVHEQRINQHVAVEQALQVSTTNHFSNAGESSRGRGSSKSNDNHTDDIRGKGRGKGHGNQQRGDHESKRYDKSHIKCHRCGTISLLLIFQQKEQRWAPKGTHFHQFVVPPILAFRSDCTYGDLAAMRLPNDVRGLGSCEYTMERGVVHACHAGGVVHLLEGWTHNEVGAIDVDRIDLVWNAALKHGFKNVKPVSNLIKG